MTKTIKLWTSLGVAAVTGAVAANAAILDQHSKFAVPKHAGYLTLADTGGEGGEGGGEGGEAGGSASAGDERIDYLTDLGLLEGHMRVGVALYKAGDAAAAKTHMRHPEDEIYEDLKLHFEELKAPGFAEQLTAVGKAVESGAAAADVDAAMSALLAAIAAARKTEMNAEEVAQVVQLLVSNAAEDYAGGINNGTVTDAHEYQDAWGFVQTAKAYMAALPAHERDEYKAPLAEIDAQLAKLDAAFPDIQGKLPLTADPTLFPAVASSIEFAAASIK